MSQIKSALLLLTVASAFALSGCGNENSNADFDNGKHPGDWITTHKSSARTDIESCRECHGETLDGGISAASCMSATAVNGFKCHVTSPAANPVDCLSCHGGPPFGPYGNSAPNRNFAHTQHNVVADCKTCHLDAGYGTADHSRATSSGGYRPASVKMGENIKAQTVPISFGYVPATQNCSGVSCHGGQTSPSWNQKIILVAGNNSLCLQCHEPGTAPVTLSGAPSPQYNSFYSGIYGSFNLHTDHLNRGSYCTDCHNIGVLTDFQQHYSGTAVNNPTESASNRFADPGSSIGGSPTSIGHYVKATKTCGTVSCHPSAWGDIQWNFTDN